MTATLFTTPFYEGAGVSGQLGGFDLALDGFGYILDWEMSDRHRRASIPLLRPQADTGDRPGEASVNPEGLWRRAVESWHLGAGQDWNDKEEAEPFRFRTSKGIDCWTRYQITCLPDTSLALASASSNLFLATTGTALYATEGANVHRTTDGSSFTACTGEPASQATGITSDGTTVYAAFGTDRVYSATGTVFAAYITSGNPVTGVAYAKGRLVAWHNNLIYVLTATGALPAPFFTHDNANFTWVAATPGPRHIYMAGVAGDKSLIYRIGIKDDGTGLNVPLPAGELPDGEIVTDIEGYLGFLIICTTTGVRFAVPNEDGTLTLGARIPTSGTRCADGDDKYVWFGWDAFDASSSGLGRLDPTQFIAALTPAYASDLMATVTGQVPDTTTFGGKRFFTVAGSGVWKQGTGKAVGTLSNGKVTYGLPDNKTALFMDLRHLPLTGTVGVALSVDSGTSNAVATSTVAGSVTTSESIKLNQLRGGTFEWTLTLTPSAGVAPAVTRVALRVDPNIGTQSRTESIFLPLLLHERVQYAGVDIAQDVEAAYNHAVALRDSRRLVIFEQGVSADSVIVEDTEWLPTKKTEDGRLYQGTLVVRLKKVA